MFGLHIATVLAFAALLLWAAGADIHRLTIPNWVSLAMIGLYPVHVLVSPVPVNWSIAVLIAVATLAVGFLLFAFKMIGGGDVKLLTATALWTQPALFPSFIFLTAIAGGVIGLAILLLRRRRMAPAAVDSGHSVGPAVMPYGVAIAVGGLMVALTLLKGANL
jgi:prepilin peptidase CpaA